MIGRTLILLSTIFLCSVSCGTDKDKKNDKAPEARIKTPAELLDLNRQILENPGQANLYHQRAKYYLENHKYQLGLADMNTALGIDSLNSDYYLTSSELNFVNNQTSKAKTHLEKSIALNPQNTDALLKLAELHLYFKEHDKSISYLNRALKLDQYNAKAYFIKGICYKELKDTARAISSMQTAVEQDKEYYHAYVQLGLLFAKLKNKLAIDYYKNALRIQPQSTEAFYNLAKYYQDTEDFKKSLETYEKLLEVDPGNKFAYYNMGVIHLVKLKKPKIAIEHFSKAIALDQLYAQAYYGLGLAYQEEGNKKMAIRSYQDCLRVDPNYTPATEALNMLQ